MKKDCSVAFLFFSNTTVGDDMVAIDSVARTYNLRHVNLQYVSMGRVIYPDLDLADEYYLYAQRTYKLYSSLNSSYRYYLPLQHKIEKKTDQKEVVFVIFMQPDSWEKDYLLYFDMVLPEIVRLDIYVKIIIKPHYRQNNIQILKQYQDKYGFLRVAAPDESVESLLNNATFAMSICSSVIFEAMMNHVPTIVYNPEGRYDDYVYKNDICFPNVNIVITEAEETLSVLENWNQNKIDFESRLDRFISESGANTDINEILYR